MRTAYFSKVRSPGVVFLVSKTLQGRSFTASTYFRVKVAVPDKRWKNLKRVRSARNRAARGPPASPHYFPVLTLAAILRQKTPPLFRIDKKKNSIKEHKSRHNAVFLGPKQPLSLALRGN